MSNTMLHSSHDFNVKLCSRHTANYMLGISALSTGAWERVGVSSCGQAGYRHSQLWQGFHSASVWGQHQVSFLQVQRFIVYIVLQCIVVLFTLNFSAQSAEEQKNLRCSEAGSHVILVELLLIYLFFWTWVKEASHLTSVSVRASLITGAPNSKQCIALHSFCTISKFFFPACAFRWIVNSVEIT